MPRVCVCRARYPSRDVRRARRIRPDHAPGVSSQGAARPAASAAAPPCARPAGAVPAPQFTPLGARARGRGPALGSARAATHPREARTGPPCRRRGPRRARPRRAPGALPTRRPTRRRRRARGPREAPRARPRRARSTRLPPDGRGVARGGERGPARGGACPSPRPRARGDRRPRSGIAAAPCHARMRWAAIAFAWPFASAWMLARSPFGAHRSARVAESGMGAS